ncbi:hypothetical protein [Anaerocolumna jejuensis]|uniref:hypothetical protein n=1 Tax=Anaerocolumna jejuensis TaxID=259063 RepID=UPI003F7C9066
MDYYNKHYIRLDANSCIIKGFSDAFEQPEDGDICINQEGGRHFELLGQVNPNLYDGYGCPIYKYNPATQVISETTNAEKQAGLVARKTLEQVQNEKITELSFLCNKTIESGINVTVSNGTQHYALKDFDQIEILTLTGDIAAGATEVPYHADGEGCRKYPAEEFMVVSNEARRYVTYNRTYFNQAKRWIEILTTKEEVNGITWGTPLPEEYDNIFKSITGVSTRS